MLGNVLEWAGSLLGDDLETRGALALASAAVLAAGTATAWWRRRRPREGSSRVRLDVPAGQRVSVTVGHSEEE